MCGLGVRAVAINSETITAAKDEGRDLMDEVRRCRWSVSLWSPEKLTSSGADAVIRDETFRRNLALYGVDETHVVYIWGASFRAAYRQIGLVHKRLPKHVPLVAVTATLVPGAEQNGVCDTLGLRAGKFYFDRYSNERSNVRVVVRELTHGLGGDTFPDIAWVLDAGEKVVLYCKTIELAFRVALYLWSLCPAGPGRMKAVRLWYSLTSSTYNAETLDLFTNNPDTCAIVATVAFGLGMNQRNIWKVVNVGLQDSLSPIIQQDGRAGRDLETAAVGMTYVEASAIEEIRRAIQNEGTSKNSGKSTNGDKKDKLEVNLARYLRAHVTGLCLQATINGPQHFRLSPDVP